MRTKMRLEKMEQDLDNSNSDHRQNQKSVQPVSPAVKRTNPLKKKQEIRSTATKPVKNKKAPERTDHACKRRTKMRSDEAKALQEILNKVLERYEQAYSNMVRVQQMSEIEEDCCTLSDFRLVALLLSGEGRSFETRGISVSKAQNGMLRYMPKV